MKQKLSLAWLFLSVVLAVAVGIMGMKTALNPPLDILGHNENCVAKIECEITLVIDSEWDYYTVESRWLLSPFYDYEWRKTKFTATNPETLRYAFPYAGEYTIFVQIHYKEAPNHWDWRNVYILVKES